MFDSQWVLRMDCDVTWTEKRSSDVPTCRLKHMLNYSDDIIVYSWTFEEHLHHQEALCMAFRKENTKLKLKKYQFVHTSID